MQGFINLAIIGTEKHTIVLIVDRHSRIEKDSNIFQQNKSKYL